MASSSSLSCSKPPQDQVFINFRGEELRYTFVTHLCHALERNDINVFIDEKEDRGRDITNLLERIERSKIALAIFSPGYTEAEWCLRELAKMRERMKQGELVVIPIFYMVEPSTVKRQRGEFGDNFRDLVKHRDEETKNNWTEALQYFANLPGYVIDGRSKESHIIDDIVKHVLDALNNNTSANSKKLKALEELNYV